jgi:predicted dehydrogenase
VAERTHLYFRYWTEYSGGTLTDWGAHHNDIALWALGLDRSGPATVEGKLLSKPVPGGYTAPAEYEVTYTYANGVEHRCVSTSANNIFGGKARDLKPGERAHGLLFEGADGWLYVSRGKIEASRPEILEEPLGKDDVHLDVSKNHHEDWLDCIKTRKPPIADVAIGHRSATVCHLGNIACRTGRTLRWDPKQEAIAGDAEAAAMLSRPYRKPWELPKV